MKNLFFVFKFLCKHYICISLTIHSAILAHAVMAHYVKVLDVLRIDFLSFHKYPNEYFPPAPSTYNTLILTKIPWLLDSQRI